MLHDAFLQLGLSTGGAAQLCGVSHRAMRRWRHSPGEAPEDVRAIFRILTARPDLLAALRDDFRHDAPEAGAYEPQESARRLRWLRARAGE